MREWSFGNGTSGVDTEHLGYDKHEPASRNGLYWCAGLRPIIDDDSINFGEETWTTEPGTALDSDIEPVP